MSDPTARALRLLGLLQTRAHLTGAELARRLGVTPRTVRRDAARLRELGYTIDADPGAGGGYVLGRGQVIPPLLLGDDEAIAATLALTAAAVSPGGYDPEAALRAQGKIDDLMPSALRHRVRELRGALDLRPAPPTADPEVLIVCARAVHHRCRLRFHYRDRHGESSDRIVEPHRVAERAGRWWLAAYDLARDDWRRFRLDRISGPMASTLHFAPRSGADEALARIDAPTPPSAWRHPVLVRVRAPLARVADVFSSGDAQLRALDERTTELRSGAEDPAAAAWWLARLPFEFTVVEDAEVRAAVADLGSRLSRSSAPDATSARQDYDRTTERRSRRST